MKIDHYKATGSVYVCVARATCRMFLSMWAAMYSRGVCGYTFVYEYYIRVAVWIKR